MTGPRIVKRWLIDVKLSNKHPYKKPLILVRNKLAKLEFVRQYLNWIN